jgi:hypothetical protein
MKYELNRQEQGNEGNYEETLKPRILDLVSRKGRKEGRKAREREIFVFCTSKNNMKSDFIYWLLQKKFINALLRCWNSIISFWEIYLFATLKFEILEFATLNFKYS